MEDIIHCSVNFLKENKAGLLITIMEDSSIDSRLIGPYLNDDLIVYIFTLNNSNKIKQILKNSNVSFYLQNNFENIKELKSLLINGKASNIISTEQILDLKNKLEIKSKGYKEWIDKDGWDKWSIIKIEPESLKYIDNSRWREPKIIKIAGK
jgi:general stress protein 26